MSDEALIVDKTGSIFSWSYLVRAAVGESIDNETLGGATTHCEISGVTDYKAKATVAIKIKTILDKMGSDKAGFNRIESAEPKNSADELFRFTKI